MVYANTYAIGKPEVTDCNDFDQREFLQTLIFKDQEPQALV